VCMHMCMCARVSERKREREREGESTVLLPIITIATSTPHKSHINFS
jgi:hypothetical protein